MTLRSAAHLVPVIRKGRPYQRHPVKAKPAPPAIPPTTPAPANPATHSHRPPRPGPHPQSATRSAPPSASPSAPPQPGSPAAAAALSRQTAAKWRTPGSLPKGSPTRTAAKPPRTADRQSRQQSAGKNLLGDPVLVPIFMRPCRYHPPTPHARNLAPILAQAAWKPRPPSPQLSTRDWNQDAPILRKPLDDVQRGPFPGPLRSGGPGRLRPVSSSCSPTNTSPPRSPSPLESPRPEPGPVQRPSRQLGPGRARHRNAARPPTGVQGRHQTGARLRQGPGQQTAST